MSEERSYEIFNLDAVISEFPPDPDTVARHRAEILVKSETLRVVLVTALKGGFLNEPSAPGPITIQVVEGKFTLTIDGEDRLMDSDDIAIVAPGVRHGVMCEEEGAFLLTIAHLSRVPDEGGQPETPNA